MKYKHNLVKLLIALSFLPLLTVFGNLNFKTAFDVSRFLAQLCGLIGLIILNWQFILSSKYLSKLLNLQLVNLNQLHKFLGIYGVLVIFLHPVLMVIGYTNKTTSLLTLIPVTTFDTYVFLGKVAISLVLVTWLSSKLARKWLTFRMWKFLHLFTYLIFPLVAYHAYQIGVLSQSVLLTNYLYLLVLIFVLVIVLKLLQILGLLGAKYTLKEIKSLTPDVNEYSLFTNGRTLNIKPGNYVYVRTQMLGESHPFTVSKINPDHITITTKILGKFSKQLAGAKVEDSWYLDGPFGDFTTEAYSSESNFVVIAGGIGITPFIELSRRLGTSNKFVKLIYGNKTQTDIAYYEELNAGLGSKLLNVLSAETKSSLPNTITGYVTKQVILDQLTSNPNKYDFYVCGPPIMMNLVIKSLVELGVPKLQIKFEEFSF